MLPRRKSLPSYLPHKQSGRPRAVWTDATGTRHQKLLPGLYESPESRVAFGKMQLDLAASPLHAPPGQFQKVAVSPDGSWLAAADEAGLRAWDYRTGGLL